jgi:hypothetical protein
VFFFLETFVYLGSGWLRVKLEKISEELFFFYINVLTISGLSSFPVQSGLYANIREITQNTKWSE